MSLLNYFRRNKETATVAKERLQIIISHERAQHRSGLDYLPKLQKEIIDVIAKYVDIDKEHVKVELDREGENAILELNITLPEQVLAEEA